jgi:hypothetical protein
MGVLFMGVLADIELNSMFGEASVTMGKSCRFSRVLPRGHALTNGTVNGHCHTEIEIIPVAYAPAFCNAICC